MCVVLVTVRTRAQAMKVVYGTCLVWIKNLSRQYRVKGAMCSLHFNSTSKKNWTIPSNSQAVQPKQIIEITCFRNIILTCGKYSTMFTKCTCSLEEKELGDTQEHLIVMLLGCFLSFHPKFSNELIHGHKPLTYLHPISTYQANLRLVSKFLLLLWWHPILTLLPN